jgi:small-conductance mechanosensitive channel
LLLVRRIVFWALVVAILGFTFATDLGSLATFAGLLTAGLAVAMQSVLVSIVGYFFLIGKYGIRVGDRVQIGSVNGEVIDLGLVRLHLMELIGQAPTGRVVVIANSIVFQASGGIFKQIPGVDLAWHDITLTLPAKADPYAMKEELLAAANHVLSRYSEDMARQTREIQKTSSLHDGSEPQAQVLQRRALEPGLSVSCRHRGKSTSAYRATAEGDYGRCRVNDPSPRLAAGSRIAQCHRGPLAGRAAGRSTTPRRSSGSSSRMHSRSAAGSRARCCGALRPCGCWW